MSEDRSKQRFIRFSNDLIPFENFEKSSAIWEQIKDIRDPKEQVKQAIYFDLAYGPLERHGHRDGFTVASALIKDDAEFKAILDELDVQNEKKWPKPSPQV